MNLVRRMARNPLVVAILLIGVASIAAADITARHRAEAELERWLDERGNLVIDATQQTLDKTMSDLTAVAAFLEGNPDADPQAFTDFVRRIEPSNSLVGIALVGIVPEDRIGVFIEQMQQEIPGYQITEMDAAAEWIPAGERPVYYPVVLFEPGQSLIGALAAASDLSLAYGFDAGSDQLFAASLASVAGTGRAALSDFIRIPGLEIAQVFIILVPVLAEDGSVTGIVGAPALDILLTGTGSPALRDVSWSVTTAEGESVTSEVTGDGVWVSDLEVADARWRFSVSPAESARSVLPEAPSLLIWSVGLTLTALLAVTTHLLVARLSSRRRILELQQRAHDKDRFLAAVSHEIRTPLTVVLGMVHELRSGPESFNPDETDELLGLAEEQAEEVASIVEDLLTAARADIGLIEMEVSTVDLREATERALPGSAGDVTIEGRVAGRVDPGRFRQIIRNLLTNARRYGGDVIEVRLDARDGMAVVEVADSGSPIPPEKRKAIFDPYTTAHRRGESMGSVGLGLYISLTLARAMGGHLGYRHDGTWSIFELVVPLGSADDLTDSPGRPDLRTTHPSRSDSPAAV